MPAPTELTGPPEPVPGDPEVTLELARAHQLSDEEYERILALLDGRTPTFTELGVYSVMWSEHASYKNSILQLKTLPRSGGRLLVAAGEENAGLVDIGDGWAVAFKIESHNHPSAVEPYQGAATGVGGILRDVFTMGARPIALLDSLRFGSPSDRRVRYLFDGVVRGIADYGNCVGVPTVGGELYFEDAYRGNPLVNAMAVGIVHHDRVLRATAEGAGNSVIYIGSRTGRDGIHGATFASEELSEESTSRRSNVQVGDPFTEKLLLEATLALAETDALVGIQDMGAAGLTCSSCEMAGRGGAGILLDLDRVPLREPGMTPYEIMLSESQERMLVVAKRGREHEVFEIVRRWDLQAVEVGSITDDGRMRATSGGKLVIDIPVESLVLGGGAPHYEREAEAPEPVTFSARTGEPEDFSAATLALLASANIASRRHVFQQYDHMVRANTRVGPGRGDAAVVRVPGTRKALALATDCNARLLRIDPREGARQAVAEACRNVACAGATPLGITNCLNFGNPYKPAVYWTFREAVAGMGEACRALAAPVTGGNVSFYNENPGGAVYPTPVIGAVGLTEDVERTTGMGFVREGEAVFLLGPSETGWAGSEWQALQGDEPAGALVPIDLELEAVLQRFLIRSVNSGWVSAAHDLSEGGLVVAIAEMALASPGRRIGAMIELEEVTALALFGEGPSRVAVTVPVAEMDAFEQAAEAEGVPAQWLGTTGGDGIGFRTVFSVSMHELARAFDTGLGRALGLIESAAVS
ncbi:MAG: Phosphoribosylformylglycinamidine synthase subunit PurL [Calditrichaeota bacterium]|nr:Phosphoribosylformylglycinamidine synthase subunit PurL [Calditrichota bacterium]